MSFFFIELSRLPSPFCPQNPLLWVSVVSNCFMSLEVWWISGGSGAESICFMSPLSPPSPPTPSVPIKTRPQRRCVWNEFMNLCPRWSCFMPNVTPMCAGIIYTQSVSKLSPNWTPSIKGNDAVYMYIYYCWNSFIYWLIDLFTYINI